jgi:hypothetical protein
MCIEIKLIDWNLRRCYYICHFHSRHIWRFGLRGRLQMACVITNINCLVFPTCYVYHLSSHTSHLSAKAIWPYYPLGYIPFKYYRYIHNTTSSTSHQVADASILIFIYTNFNIFFLQLNILTLPLHILRRHNFTTATYFWFQTFAVFCMLYVFFWVIPRRLNFINRRFGTLYLFHLHRQQGE